jgi:hypothetical protein
MATPLLIDMEVLNDYLRAYPEAVSYKEISPGQLGPLQ